MLRSLTVVLLLVQGVVASCSAPGAPPDPTPAVVLPDPELNAAPLAYRDIMLSHVRVLARHRDGVPAGFGSGFFVDAHHVVTALHVVASASKVIVHRYIFTASGPRRTESPAALVAHDYGADLALLRVDPFPANPSPPPPPITIPLTFPSFLRPGDAATVFAHPGTAETPPSSDFYVVEALDKRTLVGPSYPGASGGGVYVRTDSGYALAGMIRQGGNSPPRILHLASLTAGEATMLVRIFRPSYPATTIVPAPVIREFLARHLPGPSPAIRLPLPNPAPSPHWKTLSEAPVRLRISTDLGDVSRTLIGGDETLRDEERSAYGHSVPVACLLVTPGSSGWAEFKDTFDRIRIDVPGHNVRELSTSDIELGSSSWILSRPADRFSLEKLTVTAVRPNGGGMPLFPRQ